MPAPPQGPPPLDPELVAQLRADLAPDDLREVCRLVREDAALMLGAMAAAVERQDQEAWRRALHRLAGGAASVGAIPLERLTREAMAEPASAGRIAAIGAAVAATVSALDRLAEGPA
jgi:HPt (histidine-containing phosphotransfer) domain-containing protein